MLTTPLALVNVIHVMMLRQVQLSESCKSAHGSDQQTLEQKQEQHSRTA